MNTLTKSDFLFKNQISKYDGKVRDVYFLENDILLMIVSDRISAFDVVMPVGITYKGQILNQIAFDMLKSTEDIINNWIIDSPDPNVTLGKKCTQIKVEMVVRGYLSGHSYRFYNSGKRDLCGNKLPDNLKENDKFPSPIITPTTKADKGFHDQDISPKSIIQRNILTKEDYDFLHQKSLELFERGSELANKNGLILVDTKYEFGYDNFGNIVLIDEIHTPDSSRYFYKDTYEELQLSGKKQRQLSKEFFREWLMKNNFQGLEGQTIPNIDSEVVKMVSSRYIELYEKLLGKKFLVPKNQNINERILSNLKDFI
ncbi:MAG: phosphoribosylaminoimidazolesuccinocarboxamide synthase [Flavobacteriaceae bacterium]|nr:phosphoribosylaminoimidazolesuccinocarboxamide synthase [Flavobacteriaceae bacterium]MBL6680721.1 phosphoribosylaminoimidazolesuccinocarboxamide synthase [Flavobacteriaceae bacterium]